MKFSPGVVILFVVLFIGYNHRDNLSLQIPNVFNQQSNTVTYNRSVTEPSAELKIAVQPIISIIKTSQTTRDKTYDAFAFGDFYGEFVKVLIYKDGPVKTMAILRDTLVAAGKVHFGNIGHTESDYPGLAKAIDGYFATQIGLDNVVLDIDKVSKSLLALQWAFYESVK